MKRRLFALITVMLLLTAGILYWYRQTSAKTSEREQTSQDEADIPGNASNEIRAVWVNYNELSMKAEGGGTAEQFRAKAEEMTADLERSGMNTVIVHVRAFCDAFYPSDIYPWTAYLTGTQGQAVDYDPLQIFIACAESHHLSVQAWINPYRVLLSTDWDQLSDDNPAKQWYLAGKTENLLLTDEGIYLNPASYEAQALILNGVREILRQYEVDAIHMDDYFYPTTDFSVDSASYAAYTEAGGKLPQDEWRRESVSTFVSSLYAAIKAIDPSVQLVISPGGDIQKNHDNLCADVERWAREEGFVDVLMPQLYYGFENESKPFSETAAQWAALEYAEHVQLCFGLAAYKSGKEDIHAGSGHLEWQENSDILARQVTLCRTLPHYSGFALYTYSSIYQTNSVENAKKEWKNLESVLQ